MSGEQKTNRRQFLAGESAVEALAAVGDAQTLGPGNPLARPSEAYQIRIGRRAMACEFEVILNAGEYDAATDEALAALDLVEELEAQLTVYREGGELMEINRRAASQPVPVERRLFDLLRQAIELNRETDGAYDITSGPLSKVWGFFRRQGTIPSATDLEDALRRVGSAHVQLVESVGTVRFMSEGIELNLGSIGKGYALDRVAEGLLEHSIEQFLVHGGQSSVLARGRRADSDQGWPVGIWDPRRPGQRLATVHLHNRALGTSGAATQFFRHQGRRYGHILDPRTGWPAEGVLSATAIAKSAAEADALSTAFFVMGPEKSREYCQKHPEIAAVVVVEIKSGYDIQTWGLAGGEVEFA